MRIYVYLCINRGVDVLSVRVVTKTVVNFLIISPSLYLAQRSECIKVNYRHILRRLAEASKEHIWSS